MKLPVFDRITSFLAYWYMRYLLVSELYMVETWERVFIHFLMIIFFSMLSYMNVILIRYLYSVSEWFQLFDIMGI